MAWEPKNNSGRIFKNKNKKNENSPPLRGDAFVEGNDYWVSAWKKTDKNGEDYVSFSLTRKNPSSDQSQTIKQVDLDEDSIPF